MRSGTKKRMELEERMRKVLFSTMIPMACLMIILLFIFCEISELFSLPASTLRYYESEGLLPNVEKSSSGQRIYTEEHIERQ